MWFLMYVISPLQPSSVLPNTNQYGMGKQSQDGHLAAIWRLSVSCSLSLRSFSWDADGSKNDRSGLLGYFERLSSERSSCFFFDISVSLNKVKTEETGEGAENNWQRLETVARIHRFWLLCHFETQLSTLFNIRECIPELPIKYKCNVVKLPALFVSLASSG